MARLVTFQGDPLSLTGRQVKIGQRAYDFRLVAQDLKVVKFSDFKGKIKVINFFPSLDTPVCDLEIHRFNQEAASISQDVVILFVSMDLPFAQKRFCAAAGIKSVRIF